MGVHRVIFTRCTAKTDEVVVMKTLHSFVLTVPYYKLLPGLLSNILRLAVSHVFRASTSKTTAVTVIAAILEMVATFRVRKKIRRSLSVEREEGIFVDFQKGVYDEVAGFLEKPMSGVVKNLGVQPKQRTNKEAVANGHQTANSIESGEGAGRSAALLAMKVVEYLFAVLHQLTTQHGIFSFPNNLPPSEESLAAKRDGDGETATEAVLFTDMWRACLGVLKGFEVLEEGFAAAVQALCVYSQEATGAGSCALNDQVRHRGFRLLEVYLASNPNRRPCGLVQSLLLPHLNVAIQETFKESGLCTTSWFKVALGSVYYLTIEETSTELSRFVITATQRREVTGDPHLSPKLTYAFLPVWKKAWQSRYDKDFHCIVGMLRGCLEGPADTQIAALAIIDRFLVFVLCEGQHAAPLNEETGGEQVAEETSMPDALPCCEELARLVVEEDRVWKVSDSKVTPMTFQTLGQWCVCLSIFLSLNVAHLPTNRFSFFSVFFMLCKRCSEGLAGAAKVQCAATSTIVHCIRIFQLYRRKLQIVSDLEWVQLFNSHLSNWISHLTNLLCKNNFKVQLSVVNCLRQFALVVSDTVDGEVSVEDDDWLDLWREHNDFWSSVASLLPIHEGLSKNQTVTLKRSLGSALGVWLLALDAHLAHSTDKDISCFITGETMGRVREKIRFMKEISNLPKRGVRMWKRDHGLLGDYVDGGGFLAANWDGLDPEGIHCNRISVVTAATLLQTHFAN
eukprot:Platyproteum_vivax@DN16115_c0_g1_i1.p1